MVLLKCYATVHMLVCVVMYCQSHLRFLFALRVKFVDVQLVSRKWSKTNKLTTIIQHHLCVCVYKKNEMKWNLHDEWYRVNFLHLFSIQIDVNTVNVLSKHCLYSLTITCINHAKKIRSHRIDEIKQFEKKTTTTQRSSMPNKMWILCWIFM